MIFKSDIYIVKKEGKQFPVGTPKLIKNLKLGNEVQFEMRPWHNSSVADSVTVHVLTNGEQHTLKKGKLFNAISDIKLALK